MSTVLRVKRRAEESPQDALILLSKRLKTESSHKESSDLDLNVFVFSGTVRSTENLHLKQAFATQNNRFNNLNPTRNTEEILKRIRNERRQASLAGRYEILNLSRGLKEESEKDNYAVVDVAKTSQEDKKDVEYAYDLYFSEKKDFGVSTLDDVVRIEDLEQELMFGSHRDNGRRTPSDASSVSSDDSNDENNWRNDYPDTDNSLGEEEMRKAIEDIDIGNDLSSDAEEEEIYNEPSINLHELNNDDVQRYGLAYAKYKSRVLAETNIEEENVNLSSAKEQSNSCSNGITGLVTKIENIEDKSGYVFCSKLEDSEESSEGYKDDEDGFYYGMEEDGDNFVSQYREEESDDDFVD